MFRTHVCHETCFYFDIMRNACLFFFVFFFAKTLFYLCEINVDTLYKKTSDSQMQPLYKWNPEESPKTYLNPFSQNTIILFKRVFVSRIKTDIRAI